MQTTLYTGLSLTVMLCLALGADAAAPERPSWMPAAPPLRATGRIVNVSDEPQLRAALSGARDGDTIMLADGVYRLTRFLELRGKRRVVIRGASGDTTKVTIRGLGWESGTNQDDLLRIRGCSDVTIAFITFADCHAYGVKLEQTPLNGRQLRNINIHGCNFLNIGTRAIKGTGGGGGFVDGGSIRYCTFENTKVPPRTWFMNGDYISSIDCMRLGLDDRGQLLQERPRRERRRPRRDLRLGGISERGLGAERIRELRPLHLLREPLRLQRRHGSAPQHGRHHPQ